MTSELLVVPTDPETEVLAFLDSLRASGGPLERWGLGTRTPENETPDRFVQVQQIDGDNPNPLLFRHTLQVRVWEASERTAKRYANLVLAYVRRSLGARTVSQPVRLPDPVDNSRSFFQCSFLLPTMGIAR